MPAHTAASIMERFYDAERDYMAEDPATADPSAMAATLSPDIVLYQSPDLPCPSPVSTEGAKLPKLTVLAQGQSRSFMAWTASSPGARR